MKDKVVKLGSGLEYYILDELEKNSKKYVFAVQVDNESEEVTNNYLICESISDINGGKFEDIVDDNLFEEISNEFLKRINDNN